MRQTFLTCCVLTFALSASAATPLAGTNLTGTWKEKSGGATYVFDDGFNFEFRLAPNPRVMNDFGTVKKGIWTLAPDNCAVGSSKGNLYIQAGTDRCCYNAYFLGSNLVLTAIVQPTFVGVCSDRVLEAVQP